MRRVHALWVLAGVVLLTAGFVVAQIVNAPAPPQQAQVRAPRSAAAERAAAEHAAGVEADGWWRNAEERAADALAAGDWFHALAQITDPEGEQYAAFARATRLGQIEDAILAAAAKDEPLDGGLGAVFLRAQQIRSDRKSTDAMLDRADQALAWASARALAPYGADLRALSAAYRAVRFGDGRLDAEPKSPVRRFLFAEAAAELRRSRGALQTWLHEQRLLRKCAGLERLDADWKAFVREFAAVAARAPELPVRGLLEAEGARVVLDPRKPPDERGFTLVADGGEPSAGKPFRWFEPTPAAVAAAVVLPRLHELEPATVLGLARVYTELGEVAAATECLAHAEVRLPPSDPEIRAELTALRELLVVTPGGVPADLTGLEVWAERHSGTDAWLATGNLGAKDLGAFEDEAVNAYFGGGILWSPPQWKLVQRRTAEAVPATFEGLAGFQVESDHFTVFTDVSATFAAQATLVLDAAYEQAADVLGVVPAPRQRAVVYRHRASYLARFRNDSDGCWNSADGTLYCFLDDPAHTRFCRFEYPTLLHEAAHAALGTGTRHHPPSWMHEGVACWFERWNPSRSVAANTAATGDSLLRAWSLRTENDRPLPELAALLKVRTGWDADNFGPVTLQRYALAESLFVHLMGDPARRRFVGRFVDAVNAGDDPAAALTEKELADLAASWSLFIAEADRGKRKQ